MDDRRNVVAKEVLFYLLNDNGELALKILQKADVISTDRHNITVDEIKDLLYPWTKGALRDRSH